MNITTIRIVLVLFLLADWMARIFDMKGAFLKKNIENGEEIFMEVLQGIDCHYSDEVLFTIDLWELALWKLEKILVPRKPPYDYENGWGGQYQNGGYWKDG